LASNKQLEANRANAKNSTGPRSQAGKASSRRNSRKHGLTAKLLVIGDEDPAEFEELLASLMEQYDPQGPTECELVEYLAGVYWRLRRFPLFETAIFAARQAQVAEDLKEENARRERFEEEGEAGEEEDEEEMSDAEWLVHVGRALIKDGVWNDALGKLSRHEATQFNALRKMLILLEEMRDKRKNDPVTINAVAVPRAA
jgi:hypothetical protein